MRARRKIRTSQYVITNHAAEEMYDEGLRGLDVECGILTGKILEKQIDEKTRESKYRVRGGAMIGEEIEIIIKFSPTGKLVVITVYQL